MADKQSLQAIFEQHQKLLEQLNQDFTSRLAEADQKFQNTLDRLEQAMQVEEEKPKEEQKPKDVPAAVWMVVEGEHMLVLNQAAAVQQLALLDKLAEVLKELGKLAPKRGRSAGI